MNEVKFRNFAETFKVIPDSNTKVKRSAYLEMGEIPVVDQGQEMIGGYTNSESTVKLSELPVIVFGDHTRVIKFIDFEFAAGADGTQILSPLSGVYPKYSYYYLMLHISNIPSKGYARHFGEVKKLKFPIPSLEKQKEIVEKLDSAFAQLANYERNQNSILDLNDKLLTAKIDDEFSRAKFESVASSLGELAKINYGYTAKSEQGAIGPKYLRITDIQDKLVDWDLVPHCRISPQDYVKFKLSIGDIVFARTGATTGKSFLMNEDVDSVFASYLIRLKPDIRKLDSTFLSYFFHSSFYWNEIAGGISGSAQGGFNATKLQEMSVHFPVDIGVQRDIASRIKSFQTELLEMRSNLVLRTLKTSDLISSLFQNSFSEVG